MSSQFNKGVSDLMKKREKEKGPLPPPALDPRMESLTARAAYDRNADFASGAARFDPLFGMNNPEMARIMKARMDAAFGRDGYADTLRAQGTQGINQTMQTGLRQVRGLQATNGVRGGAALGQALPVLSGANQARAGLEQNIALADMQRRQAALGDLEKTVTGERAGSLGAQFGWAGLGAADRNNAMQYLMSGDFLANARAGMPGGGGGDPSKPWWQQGPLGGITGNPLGRLGTMTGVGGVAGAAADKWLPKPVKKTAADAEEEVRSWFGG